MKKQQSNRTRPPALNKPTFLLASGGRRYRWGEISYSMTDLMAITVMPSHSDLSSCLGGASSFALMSNFIRNVPLIVIVTFPPESFASFGINFVQILTALILSSAPLTVGGL